MPRSPSAASWFTSAPCIRFVAFSAIAFAFMDTCVRGEWECTSPECSISGTATDKDETPWVCAQPNRVLKEIEEQRDQGAKDKQLNDQDIVMEKDQDISNCMEKCENTGG